MQNSHTQNWIVRQKLPVKHLINEFTRPCKQENKKQQLEWLPVRLLGWVDQLINTWIDLIVYGKAEWL